MAQEWAQLGRATVFARSMAGALVTQGLSLDAVAQVAALPPGQT